MTIFSRMLSEDSIFIYSADQQVSKDDVIRRLCAAVAEDLGGIDADQIEALIQKREVSLSTRLNTLLAVPHAVIPGSKDNKMAVAVIPGGLDWDSDRNNPIRLVVLLAGGRGNHLKILSEMAMTLQDEELLQRLVSALNAADFLSLLQQPEEFPDSLYHDRLGFSSLIFHEAVKIRDSIESARLILYADAIEDNEFIESLVKETDAVIVTSREGRFDSGFSDENSLIVMPIKGVKRSAQVQFTLMYLLSHKVLSPADIIVNIFGQSGSGLLDSIRLTHLMDMEIPFTSQTEGFPEDLEISTFTRVLQVSTQIAAEGREGKPVGTLFVVGDYEGV
ncbi:MAG: PTS sugar transporter subunit IIA, partial [Spirochaetales bacterium]|nr:PTS sugar transporter subunit IIA [Spirochaetales bacterium]